MNTDGESSSFVNYGEKTEEVDICCLLMKESVLRNTLAI